MADWIVAYTEAGVETALLQFQPFAPGLARFEAEVMPRVRERLAARIDARV